MKREEYKTIFDDSSKIKAFEEIESEYFNTNFGTLSKADFEIILFKIYYERLKENSNTSSDYDNYSISKALGITQSKVKLLKEKMGLKYPSSINWQEEIKNHIKAFEYHDNNEKEIKFIIDDDYCLKEFQRFVLNSGCFYDGSFNSKIITFKIDSFFKLFKDKNVDYNQIFDQELLNNIQKNINVNNNQKLINLIKEASADNIKDIIKLSSKVIILDILNSLNSKLGKSELLDIFIELIKDN